VVCALMATFSFSKEVFMSRLGTGGNASKLNDHIEDLSNPHATTASQIGAEIAGSASAVQWDLDLHEANLSNPHSTTASQVGADPIGSSGSVQDNLDIHAGNLSNPHSTTASQIFSVVDSPSFNGLLLSVPPVVIFKWPAPTLVTPIFPA